MLNAATTTRPTNRRAAEYPSVLLHYVRKSNITESAVLGTDMHALCGFTWTADKTNYAATANPGRSKGVICPMCADMFANLPVGGGE
ncbi:DUF3039 domain-containing protein [Arthrobacter sp. M4]|uniref:DUF3039 domain-containing protein n=1 Tax=Arthrobacter sp. M4 TaxID=218160 RepID=UPI001CDD5AF8|nr:DUF3039 domain-containing protein [Arthrobacter sp. M4]MCA4132960.1 DUF3039 domain-containing protein [Arthrobacter sp. M4]